MSMGATDWLCCGLEDHVGFCQRDLLDLFYPSSFILIRSWHSLDGSPLLMDVLITYTISLVIILFYLFGDLFACLCYTHFGIFWQIYTYSMSFECVFPLASISGTFSSTAFYKIFLLFFISNLLRICTRKCTVQCTRERGGELPEIINQLLLWPPNLAI